MSRIHWRYIFAFNTAEEQQYNLYFDDQNMSLLDESFDNDPKESLEWAKLDTNKCSHCPLSSKEFEYCPAAISLGKVARKFANVKSYTETKVAVVSSDRTYLKQTSTQEALHSIFGLIMATSGCPYLNFLKPMARFHLPFSNSTETLVRSLSFYFLKQYFMSEKQKSINSFTLEELSSAYNKLQTVNLHLVDRIRTLGKGDADLNAIVILDSFASLLSMQIGEDFSELRPLFE